MMTCNAIHHACSPTDASSILGQGHRTQQVEVAEVNAEVLSIVAVKRGGVV
jgi:hypothetical protein